MIFIRKLITEIRRFERSIACIILSRFQILGFRLVICAEPQNSGFEARHVNTHDVMMTLVSKESADQGLFKSTSFINFRGGGRKLEIFGCEIFVSRN
jgi:hypothetical protein